MNTERLLSISKTLNREMKKIKLQRQLQALSGHLQTSINSPHESSQRSVSTALHKIYEDLAVVDKAVDLSPGASSELGNLEINGRKDIYQLIGNGLVSQLKSVFETGYTSVETLDGLSTLYQDVTDLSESLENIEDSFEKLGIKGEELEENESVVGIVIPREAINGSLRDFRDEIDFFTKLLADFTEIYEGSARESEVRSIHSSDFGIDISTSLIVASNLARVISITKRVYDSFKDRRQLKQDATNLNVKEDIVKELTKDNEEKMAAAISEIEVEIFQECKVEDEGRVNELKTSARFKVNGMVNRMDRGFKFEIKTRLPSKPSKEESEMEKAVSSFSEIVFEPFSKTRLLELPEAEENSKEDEEQKNGKSKK